MKCLFYIGCTVTFALAQPALAQRTHDPCARTICAGDVILPVRRVFDEEITVLASGSRQHVEDAGQSISVIGADELDSIQSPDLTSALQRLPGVSISRNGGPGSFTGLRVRGAGAEQVLVLIDGIRVADVASPGGGYDLGTLSSAGFGMIELLRGSNSVVWGSQAIGGVLAVASRRTGGVAASAELGTYNSFNGQAGAGLHAADHELSLNAGYTRTDGFSAAATGTEDDGFRQWRVNGTGRYELSDRLSVQVAGRYADSRLEFDGFSFTPPYGLVDTSDYSQISEWSGRAGLAYDGGGMRIDAGYTVQSIARDNYNPDFGPEPGFAARGRQKRVEAKGLLGDALNGLHLHFGADHAWERFSTSFDPRKRATSSSGHALLGWSGSRLHLAAGARIDDHSGFGSDLTLGANGAWEFAQGWRARGSYGEGFKAPTLYQLYSDYGDAALSPERSRAWEIGIERGTRSEYLHLAVTLFRRDSRDLIDFAACAGAQCESRPFGLYRNVGKARAQGFELELGARVSERLRAEAAYSYVKANDRTSGGGNRGKDLARRPRHAVSVSLDWTSPLAGLELGADLRIVSDSFDDAANFTPIDGHALATVRASFPVTEQIEL